MLLFHPQTVLHLCAPTGSSPALWELCNMDVVATCWKVLLYDFNSCSKRSIVLSGSIVFNIVSQSSSFHEHLCHLFSLLQKTWRILNMTSCPRWLWDHQSTTRAECPIQESYSIPSPFTSPSLDFLHFICGQWFSMQYSLFLESYPLHVPLWNDDCM